MGFGDFVKGQFLDVIEHVDETNKLLVWKWERYGDEIKQGAQLIVREGQAAVFICKGQMADVFMPGKYKLSTGNLPVLSSLAAVPHLFNSPIKSDLYFINMTQFIGNKWGTKSPIMMRDGDFGVVRVTAFGTYTFRVKDASVFISEVFGARKLNMTFQILEYLNSFVGEVVGEVIADSGMPVLDLSVNYRALSSSLRDKANEKARALGIEIFEAAIENVGLPEEVEKAIDEQSGIGLASKNMNTFVQYQTVRAMRDASQQSGGLAGLGAGLAFGNKITETINDTIDSQGEKASNENPVEKLREYKGLLDDEIITQEEFDTLKKQLLKL